MKKLFFSCAIFLLASQAYAIGYFSRACRVDQIPGPLRGVATEFFYLLGAPLWVKNIWAQPDLNRYWILESITTDYFQSRYYLYAKQTITQWHTWANISGWIGAMTRTSPFYTEGLPVWGHNSNAMRFEHNRRFLYSARAGSPEIVEKTEYIPGASPYSNRWRVQGEHRYYDPERGKNIKLGESLAEDCNLSVGWLP
ncbi:unnamed protein product [Mycetohabitans rhizoxinica HKI 454]|jgi:hypothetical protein|uniref:Uncharacterized protein n=2 Tax=Mycetohabitans rhizoxinica TaxID=412963 RepID=E5ANU9_MYCRK|nr:MULTISPECIES: hypothetical protein [Mycetohabitans]MCG1046518.1 hypothetical protein [Mycetohabitans sp. B6]CBW74281.1 unnamed protein product [Mycetohabitans rhizoxinica HKI 454]